MALNFGVVRIESRSTGAKRAINVSTHTIVVGAVVCVVAGLYFVPIMRMLWSGFYTPELGLSLASFNKVFEGDFYWQVIINTIRISAIVTLLCAVLAYPISYLMITVQGRMQQFVLFCVMLPLWMSVVVKTYAWLVILQKKGVINSVLMGAGLIDNPLSLVFGDFAVIIGSVHMMMPFMILPLYAALRRIDPSLYRAAVGLGARPSQAFIHVILPLSLPGVAAGGLIIFILELGFFVTPAVLGGGRVLMIAPIIQKQVDSFSNWGVVAILSAILLAITLMALAVSNKLLGRAKVIR